MPCLDSFFGIIFSGGVFRVFAGVFCENAVVGCGFLVVKLWWLGGEVVVAWW